MGGSTPVSWPVAGLGVNPLYPEIYLRNTPNRTGKMLVLHRRQRSLSPLRRPSSSCCLSNTQMQMFRCVAEAGGATVL